MRRLVAPSRHCCLRQIHGVPGERTRASAGCFSQPTKKRTVNAPTSRINSA